MAPKEYDYTRASEKTPKDMGYVSSMHPLRIAQHITKHNKTRQTEYKF